MTTDTPEATLKTLLTTAQSHFASVHGSYSASQKLAYLNSLARLFLDTYARTNLTSNNGSTGSIHALGPQALKRDDVATLLFGEALTGAGVRRFIPDFAGHPLSFELSALAALRCAVSVHAALVLRIQILYRVITQHGLMLQYDNLWRFLLSHRSGGGGGQLDVSNDPDAASTLLLHGITDLLAGAPMPLSCILGLAFHYDTHLALLNGTQQSIIHLRCPHPTNTVLCVALLPSTPSSAMDTSTVQSLHTQLFSSPIVAVEEDWPDEAAGSEHTSMMMDTGGPAASALFSGIGRRKLDDVHTDTVDAGGKRARN
ncbi:hypothetical protein RI367_002165 [Sorochytrium milnesiophthora]